MALQSGRLATRKRLIYIGGMNLAVLTEGANVIPGERDEIVIDCTDATGTAVPGPGNPYIWVMIPFL